MQKSTVSSKTCGLSDVEYSSWKGWEEADFGELDRGEESYFRRELMKVERAAGRIGSVLEVGFGNGAFLEFCRRRSINVVGAEINSSRLAAAEQQGHRVIHSDRLGNLPDGHFDCIAAFDVLEHLDPPSAVALLSLSGRKLRKGGAILLRYPNGDSWIGNVNQHGDPTHVTAIAYPLLCLYARQAGLAVRYYGPEAPRGFASGLLKGLHEYCSLPFRWLLAMLLRALFFPATPVVLTTKNIVAVLQRDS